MEVQPKNSKINGLIFRELIKRGYAVEEDIKVWNIADSKLWYLKPEQAQSYLDLLDSESYKSDYGPKEMTLIGENMGNIVQKIGDGPFNLVDLGCGDGRKAVRFVESLSKKTKVRYYPIDISAYMVEKAIEKISKLNVEEVVESRWNISDFENLMYQVRSSMKDGDYLVIGNGLESESIKESVSKLAKNKYFDDFMIKIPQQIGLKEENLIFDARFKNSRIEFFYELKEDKTIEYMEKKLELGKGDKIVIAVSYHYTKEEFTNFLKLYFDEVNLNTLEDGSYTLALCKK
jgi:uncharacterized SAM-dependent methyltransferase